MACAAGALLGLPCRPASLPEPASEVTRSAQLRELACGQPLFCWQGAAHTAVRARVLKQVRLHQPAWRTSESAPCLHVYESGHAAAHRTGQCVGAAHKLLHAGQALSRSEHQLACLRACSAVPADRAPAGGVLLQYASPPCCLSDMQTLSGCLWLASGGEHSVCTVDPGAQTQGHNCCHAGRPLTSATPAVPTMLRKHCSLACGG